MNEAVSRIVLGYNGSSEADLALRWAARTAKVQHLRLQVLIVASHMDPVVGHFREANDRLVEEWRTLALRRLAGEGVPTSPVEIQRGPTGPVLVAATGSAAMLVVGSRGHGLATGPLRGSVSQHLARHGSCPVVAVRPTRDPAAGRIVVGVDGYPESEAALRFACERAARHGGKVTVLHAYRAHATTQEQAARLLDDYATGFRDDFPGLVVEALSAPGSPAELLVEQSASASLVAVGSRGRDAIAELSLGSVSQQLLHRAECPVAVVPHLR